MSQGLPNRHSHPPNTNSKHLDQSTLSTFWLQKVDRGSIFYRVHFWLDSPRLILLSICLFIAFLDTIPALTVDNIIRICVGAGIQWSRDLCVCVFYLPWEKISEIDTNFLSSEGKWRATVDYWLSVDPTPSWRRIITGLNSVNSLSKHAPKLYQYAEPVTGEHNNYVINYCVCVRIAKNGDLIYALKMK